MTPDEFSASMRRYISRIVEPELAKSMPDEALARAKERTKIVSGIVDQLPVSMWGESPLLKAIEYFEFAPDGNNANTPKDVLTGFSPTLGRVDWPISKTVTANSGPTVVYHTVRMPEWPTPTIVTPVEPDPFNLRELGYVEGEFYEVAFLKEEHLYSTAFAGVLYHDQKLRQVLLKYSQGEILFDYGELEEAESINGINYLVADHTYTDGELTIRPAMRSRW